MNRWLVGAWLALFASGAMAQSVPLGPGGPGSGTGGGGGGTSYTAGSGLTLGVGCSGGTATTFCLGDGSLTYSSGALATTSLALGGATIGTNKLAVTGTGSFSSTVFITGITDATPALNFSTGVELWSTTHYMNIGAGPSVTIGNDSATGVILASTNFLSWSSTTNSYTGTADLFVKRDGPGVLADRNSTSAQALRVGGSFTDASNYSWAGIVAEQTGGSEGGSANTLSFGSWHVGTPGGGGSMTKFGLYVDGTLEADWNKTTASTWTMAGTINALTGYSVAGTAGASCTLTVVAHLTVVNGLVTLCN